MLHVKDLLRRADRRRAGHARRTSRRIPVVPETASLDDVLATMQRAQAHMAVVIDEHGGTAGIVSLEDLFEEVVGEIDEGAPATPSLVAATTDRCVPPARCGSTSSASISTSTSSTRKSTA